MNIPLRNLSRIISSVWGGSVTFSAIRSIPGILCDGTSSTMVGPKMSPEIKYPEN